MFIHRHHTIKLQFGPARCYEPPPISFPPDATDALALASRADREADALLAEGNFAQAERLSHLALELRCRATGARA